MNLLWSSLQITVNLSDKGIVLCQVFASMPGEAASVTTICSETFINCTCGTDLKSPTFKVLADTCYNAEAGLCQLCEPVSPCQNYKNCAQCAPGLDRCLTCPHQKYGEWCEKDCPCQNEGVCLPGASDSCLCPNGFSGRLCELPLPPRLVHTLVIARNDIPDPSKANHSLRKRQDSTDKNSVHCRKPPPPDNGKVHLETDSPEIDDAAKYTCNENFTMIGPRTRHCQQNGKWRGEAPTCEKTCSFPPTVAHVTVRVNPNRLGTPLYDAFGNEILSELEFGCDPSYVLVGAKRVRCASGVWDQEVPICNFEAQCPDIGIPENANRTTTGSSSKGLFNVGSHITFECLDNHTLIGLPSITCLPSGSWSSSLPSCVYNVIAECNISCRSSTEFPIRTPFAFKMHDRPNDYIVLNP